MPKTDASVQYLETKLNQNPQSLVFSRLADGYRKNGEIQQAIGVCMQGLKTHPDYVTGRVILGRCYLEQEKHKEAIAEFIRVIELDRRNQVAVKMIADIYSRQGMKEKAGDLYSFLLSMDPDNQSLIKLSSTFRGTGETDIHRVLGIAASAAGTAEVASGQEPPEDFITDSDRTIQMDLVAGQSGMQVQEAAELSEMLVKTQQFDKSDLGGAQGQAEELVAGAGEKEGGVVTGDDISSRMSMMFGDEDASKTVAAEPEVLDHVELGSESVTEIAGTSAGTAAVKEAGTVTGNDISSRIEQLFGEEEKAAPAAAAPDSDFTQMFDVEKPAQPAPEPSISSAPTKELTRDELRLAENSQISGEDIASRLNEMFDEGSQPEPLGEDTAGAPVPKAAAADDEKEEEPTINLPAPEATVNQMGATEEINVGAAIKAPAPDAEQGVVSGDDVALRLDTIFDEDGNDEGPGELTVAAALPDGTDLIETGDATRPEEDTKGPVVEHEGAIVIGEDEESGAASETLIAPAAKISAAAEEPQAVSEAPAIDDTVPPEEEDEAPGMSGDDVVGRLDELFNESLITGGGLESAEQIPDGDKEDEVLNQGFYTMSGENAQTAESGDAMLSELDKTEAPAPENDTADLEREPQEKTVLMDENDGEETIVSEEETIVSGGIDPFLAQPSVKAPQGEDSEETVRSDAPEATARDLFPDGESGEETAAAQTDAYNIPDHVLTPTLADIYYQQGQPRLALQIYKRLLDADPDNERMARRMREIEAGLASQEAEETVAMAGAKKKPAASAAPAARLSREKRQDEAEGPRPLAGVKIKKRFKKKIRKMK